MESIQVITHVTKHKILSTCSFLNSHVFLGSYSSCGRVFSFGWATWAARALDMPDESDIVESLKAIRRQEGMFTLLEKTVLLTLFRHLRTHRDKQGR